ncbi:MAG: bifunctional riboflavin kinase/FAD synthetase [Actinomycetota bacterium]
MILGRTADFKKHARASAVTIGVFDGVHHGHQAIIRECVSAARELTVPSVVLTFERNPRELVEGSSPCVITSPERKLTVLRRLGVDFTISVEFSRRFASLKPEEFCRGVLEGDLGAKAVCVGENFRFGAGGSGDTSTLAREGESLGFEVSTVPMVWVEGNQLSSTLIRGLIRQGRMEQVAISLDRPYTVIGNVVHGHSRGKRLGFPTANMVLQSDFCVPPDGVYAGKAILGIRKYMCAINIGGNPTFADTDTAAMEVFVMDFEGDIYGESLEVEFHARLRDERAFSTEEELIRQMQSDVARARAVLT